jgi:chorismate mutase
MEVAQGLSGHGVSLFRAGVWKPRTRPGTFEGVGESGLQWLHQVKEEFGMPVATEVANARHVELALKYNIDVLWIGARTSASPFAVQEIAATLEGSDTSVIVKNPVNPDLSLWIGSVERLMHAGLQDLALIHRGFSFFNSGRYRNSPLWQIAIDMKTRFPELPMLCDISHICGVRELLGETAQAAMDLAYDGLMIEVHPDPHHALSDREQQVTVGGFEELMQDLVIRGTGDVASEVLAELANLRDRVDRLDDTLVRVLGDRMELSRAIGEIKQQNDISILQPKRWESILSMARANAIRENLSVAFIEELFKAVHQESIAHQLKLMNTETTKVK